MTTKDSEEVVYLVGGSNESSRLSSVQFYAVSNDQWTSASDMSSARNGVGVVSYDGELITLNFLPLTKPEACQLIRSCRTSMSSQPKVVLIVC